MPHEKRNIGVGSGWRDKGLGHGKKLEIDLDTEKDKIEERK